MIITYSYNISINDLFYAMYNVEFTKQATKDLLCIPNNYSVAIIIKIKKMVVNPYSQELDVKKLKGAEGYRLRVGEYRVIYNIDSGKLIIQIIKIQSRGNVYG